MKYVTRAVRLLVRIVGLSALASFVLAGLIAFRHLLETPQPLESPLPGEAHLYRWKYGHIFYKLLGERNMPPLVLLHTPGLATSAYEMRSIMTALATRYRVYAPDLLGFGLSDRPDIDYTSDIYTQFIHDFLTHVVGEPVTLVASRLSCNYAITVAANAPDLCTRLVLLSPTALYGFQAGAFRLAPVLPNVLPARIIIVKQAQTLLYPLLVAVTRLYSRLKYGQPERLIRKTLASGSSNPPPDYMYATTHQFGAEHAPMDWLAGNLSSDVSADIQKLQQPTLLIWGTGELQNARQEHDTSGPYWGSEHTQVILLQQTASAVQEELPESVVKSILQWSLEPALKAAKTPASSNASEASSSPEAPTNQTKETGNTVKPRVEAYCIKCKEKRLILNAREVTMKNGRIAVQGTCSVCGSQLFRMGHLTPGYPQTPV
ncbi:MAG TPA: alpha/beta fold hydrolase [Ktedonobacteraceae bacterium]|nr:alpha/beta fold hydrolase [Ktedonobacteraceae bacterium]